MQRGPRFLRSFAWNHAAKLIDFGLLYLVRVLVARALGPQQDAVYAVFTNLLTFPVLLTAFGTDWVVLKHVPPAAAAGDEERVRGILRRTFFLRVLAAAAGGGLIAAALGMGAAEGSRWGMIAPYAGFAVLYLIGQNVVQFGVAANTALHRMRTVFTVNTAMRGGLFLALIAVVAFGALTPGIAIGAVSVAAAAGGIAYASGMRPLLRATAARAAMRPLLAYGAALLGQDVLYLILGRWSDILILTYWFPGSATMSLYDNGWQFGMMVQLAVTVGLGGVLFSTFAEMASHAPERMSGAYAQVLQTIQLVFLPLAGFVIVVAPTLIDVLYGPRFAPVATFVRAYVAIDCIVVGVFGGGNSALALNTIGRERFVVRNRLAWGIVNVAINLYVIPTYGALYALIVSRLSVACAEAVEFAAVRRALGKVFTARALEAPVLIAVVAGVLSWYAVRPDLIGVFVALAIFAIVTGSVVAWLRPPALLGAIEIVRRRFGGEI